MKARIINAKFWRWLFLVMLLVLVSTTVVSANSVTDQLTWVTVCHFPPPGKAEQAQTMVIYWSTLDEYLSYFGDWMGDCAQLGL